MKNTQKKLLNAWFNFFDMWDYETKGKPACQGHMFLCGAN